MDVRHLFNNGLAPWPHQLDAVVMGIDAIQHGEHCVITAPTGAGKSKIYTALIEWCKHMGLSSILYSNRVLLTDQICRTFDEHGVDYGVIAATKRDKLALLRDVQLASVQTVYSWCIQKGTHDLPKSQVVLVDEAHSNKGPACRELIERHKANGATCVGITATPVGISDIYPRLIVAGTNSGCRACGALVPAIYKSPSELDFSKLRLQDNGEFSLADIRKKWTPSIIGHVYNAWREHNPDARPTLGFAPGVKESIWFVDEFRDRGVNAAHVDGDDVYVDGSFYKKDRPAYEEVISRWKAGDIPIIWNRFVLREGIDLPEMYHLILACPIGGLHSFIQTVGRVLRRSPSTPDYVLITDHAGNYWRHRFLPNDDIPWERYFFTDVSIPTRDWLNDLAHTKDDEAGKDDSKPMEPMVCPNCGTVIRKGRQCPPPPLGCGHRIGRRSRFVIQKNGKLKTVHSRAVPPRIPKEKSETYRIWENTFYRCKNAGMTLTQAEGLFFYENHYWPPTDLPLFARGGLDKFRKIRDIPPGNLIGTEEHRVKRAARGIKPAI